MPNVSSEWVRNYEAKHMKQPDQNPIDAACKERDLQMLILQYCNRKTWIALHGSMAKSTWRTPGEWDFTILADAGRVFFVEAKTGTGKLSAAQKAIHAWAHKLGHPVHVVRSYAEFLQVVASSEVLP